jgi:serine/threonine protein kinase
MEDHASTLRRWIMDERIWCESDWFPVIFGIAIRLTNAHEAGFVHKDLKPSNSFHPLLEALLIYIVLVNRTTESNFTHQGIHISDFGVPFCSSFPVNKVSKEVPGTYRYLAPEVRLNGETSITTMSDIWAVGCIGYELCLGKKLANHGELLENHINRGNINRGTLDSLISSIPERFGEHVRTIIQECLRWIPQERCPARDLRDYVVKVSGNYI